MDHEERKRIALRSIESGDYEGAVKLYEAVCYNAAGAWYEASMLCELSDLPLRTKKGFHDAYMKELDRMKEASIKRITKDLQKARQGLEETIEILEDIEKELERRSESKNE